jgi:3-hydroxyacyl-[acyl-carrier-protein] dehydratase
MLKEKSTEVDVKSLLPYGSDFLLIDKILLYEPEHKIVTQKYVIEDEWFIKEHYPDNPIMPGHLTAEAMLQSCALFFESIDGEGKDRIIYLTSSKTRFFRVVRPNNKLIITAYPIKILSDTGIFRADAHVENELVAKGQFTLTVKTSTR